MFMMRRSRGKSSTSAKWNMDSEYFRDPTEEEVKEIHRILGARDFFQVLEVNPQDDLDENEDDLRESYLSKCLLLQPNKCGHPKLEAAYEKLSKAYDTLCDPKQRAMHRYRHYGGLPPVEDEHGDPARSLDGFLQGLLLPPMSSGPTLVLGDHGNAMVPLRPRGGLFGTTPLIFHPGFAFPGAFTPFSLQPTGMRRRPRTDSEESIPRFPRLIAHEDEDSEHEARRQRQRERVTNSDRRNRRRTQAEFLSGDDADDEEEDVRFSSGDGDEPFSLLGSLFEALNEQNARERQARRQREAAAREQRERVRERRARLQAQHEAQRRRAQNQRRRNRGSQPQAQPTSSLDQLFRHLFVPRGLEERRAPRRTPPREQRPAQPASGGGHRYAPQLQRLQEMGFHNLQRNVAVLDLVGGDIQAAISILISR